MANRISAVVPTWCEEGRITELLRRLSEEVDEVVVADADSPDATRKLAQAGNARVVAAKKGRGFQLNAGAEKATGDIFVFVHADTMVPSGFGTAIREAIDSGAEAGNFRLEYRPKTASARFFSWANDVRRRTLRIYYGDSCIFVRRDVFRLLGGFADEPIFEDYAFARRIEARRKTHYVNSPMVGSSARRFQQRPLRTLFVWTFLQCAFSLGVSPRRLARFYSDHREPAHAQP